MRRVFSSQLLSSAPGSSSVALGQALGRSTDASDWEIFFNHLFDLELRKDFPKDSDYQGALGRPAGPLDRSERREFKARKRRPKQAFFGGRFAIVLLRSAHSD